MKCKWWCGYFLSETLIGMWLTWIRAKGFSRLLIRAASCCSSSSTIDAKVTGATTEGAVTEEDSQGLKRQQQWGSFIFPTKYLLAILSFFCLFVFPVTYDIWGPGSFYKDYKMMRWAIQKRNTNVLFEWGLRRKSWKKCHKVEMGQKRYK